LQKIKNIDVTKKAGMEVLTTFEFENKKYWLLAKAFTMRGF